MPINKNAYHRYTILDGCFQNSNRRYTIDTLLQKVNELLVADEKGSPISLRQLRSDISFMVANWGIELCGEKEGRKTIYRYADPSFSIYKQDMALHHKEAILNAIDFLRSYTDNHELVNLIDILETANISVSNHNESRKIIGLDLNDDYTGITHKTILADHIRQCDVLTIHYQAFHAPKPKRYTFHPQFLKCYNNRWFLVGLSAEYPDNITLFALDRIHSFKRNSKVKYIQLTTDWADYFMNMIGVSSTKEQRPEDVVLRFYNGRARFVETKPLHNSQKKLIQVSQGVHDVRLRVILNNELKASILSFGKDVQVISPKSLVESIRLEHEEALKHYKVLKARSQKRPNKVEPTASLIQLPAL
jgi:predicted DNA-binding transcriptional regulator YafY